LFSHLLRESASEGNVHGTGYCYASKEGGVRYNKTAENAHKHVFGEEYMTFMREVPHDVHALVGHTRLASAVWRKEHEEQEQWAAHPFEVGNGVLLLHNGFLEEHERLAEDYGLEKGKYTDTLAFVHLLAEHTDDGLNIGYDTIKSALEAAGQCEYAMILLEPDGTTWAIRGVRKLYHCTTNYGILLNTTEHNIRNAIRVTQPTCQFMDWKPITFKEVDLLKEWTIHRIRRGTILDWESIADLEKVNYVPTEWEVRQAAQRALKAQGALDLDPRDDSTGYMIEAYLRAEAFYLLARRFPHIMTDADILKVLKEMNGVGDAWWSFTKNELEETSDVLWDYWNANPLQSPTEQMDTIWADILAVADDAGRDPYSMVREIDKDFVFPYFHNGLEYLMAAVKALVP
jgi:predicted glutamine amidotransferase